MKTNVLDFFESGALHHIPDAVAIVDGSTTLTFRQLADAAQKYAGFLMGHHRKPGAPIAVFLPRGAHVVIADLAILYVAHPYANLDAKTPPERLRATLAQLDPCLIITSRALSDTLIDAGADPDDLVWVENADGASMPWVDQDLMRSRVIDTDPHCIIHTSGSTGVPKAVALSHRGTIDFVEWAILNLNLRRRYTVGSLAPFHFDIYTLELFLCLSTGGKLVILPEGAATFPESLAHDLNRDEGALELIFWVPTIMTNIANADALSGVDLSALRRVLFAGEVMPPRTLRYWQRRAPEATFVNLYGPIEASVDCTFHVVDREHADDDPIPIGKPCANTGVLVWVGGKVMGRETVGSEQGELYVRGSGVALGYWNDAERDAAAFVQNPLNDHVREIVYRTGDLVHWNERGELMFDGRKDHQVKHLGQRIELAEIEAAAVQLAGVWNACAVLRREPQAAIVLWYQGPATIDAAAFRTHLGRWLPKAMLPVAFYRLDRLPTNANGKIDRVALSIKVLE